MSHKLPFPALIFGLLDVQKPLQKPNEFYFPLSNHMSLKGVSGEGEPLADVAIKPSVTTETQPGTTSPVVSSFFRGRALCY